MFYKNEFGADFDLGFNLSDYPFLKDKSWHNDISPSFYFNVGSQYYVLWVDHSDPAEREESNSRYLIQKATNEGDEANPEVYSSSGKVCVDSELFDEIHIYFNKIGC
ncbi:hypothetical protein ACRWQN_02850 [Shewanella sp. HL-SH8]|uniref:hypothetical protein n=1 Tax=Shewanella sp. HL-SH8 TaxID=3436242 RepID=UPI003EB9F8EE